MRSGQRGADRVVQWMRYGHCGADMWRVICVVNQSEKAAYGWRRDVAALPLVPAHQRRRLRYRRRRPRRRHRLGRRRPSGHARVPGPDRAQRRATRLRGGPDPDRRVVRGRVARDRDAHRGHRAAEVPRRLPPRPGVAHAGRADGGHVPALLIRTPAAQRRDRRRGRRAAGVRRLPRQGAALPAVRRVPGHRDPAVARRDRQPRRRAPARRRRPPIPAAGPGTGAVLRRLVGRGGPGGGAVQRRLPDPGRAARRGGRQAALDGRPGPAGGAHAAVRHPAARQHQGHFARGVAAGQPADRGHRRGDDTQGAGGAGAQRIRRAAPDAPVARQLARQPGGLTEPVGRRRPAARGCGNGAGRQPHRGRRPDRGVRRARHLRVHPVRVPAPGGGLLARGPARRPSDRARSPRQRSTSRTPAPP